MDRHLFYIHSRSYRVLVYVMRVLYILRVPVCLETARIGTNTTDYARIVRLHHG